MRDGAPNDGLVEKIRRFWILERDFSMEQGELTPTMKMKRREIEKKFAREFDRIYSEKSFGYVVDKMTDE